jgi:hypothetical protein
MHHRRISRRHALQLGAAAFAGSVLGPPRPALAAPAALFELDLSDALGAAAATAAAAGGWRTTRVLRAPRRFDLVGLTWSHGATLEAQVRARRRGGSWTEWLPLVAQADHAPDSERAPAGTEPAYTGAADLLQLRLRGSGRRLRARFVRAQPAARTARRLGARARASQAGALRIITRAEWGGAAVIPRAAPSYGSVQLAFVHHTVTTTAYGPAEAPGIVLGIARYHRDGNGWNDIGYNFLVDQYGQVFEGRAGGVDQAVIGAQAQGFNGVSTGIACIGDFSLAGQSEAGLDALARLLAYKLALHGVPVLGQVTVASRGGGTSRYPAGALATFERIAGHRDGNKTACPGDMLNGQLPALRLRAAGAVPVIADALTLRADRAIVRYPTPAALSGSLRFADGASPAGAAVALQWQTQNGAWLQIGSATAGADGAWSSQVTLPRAGAVRAAFGGDGIHPALASNPVAITVVPLLALGVTPRRLRAGRAISVAGTIGPRPADGRVLVAVERQVRGRWILVQRKRIVVLRGRYETRIRLRRAGLHRVWASADGTSASRRVRVLRG